MKRAVDFGLAVPVGPQKDDCEHWLTDVETSAQLLQGHFRSLWFYDHFFYDDAPAFEAWTILSFLAARFPDFEIGSLVLGQGYRNPALLALMATTLQTVSESRLTLGIGAGYKEDEYLAYNYDYPRAGIRLKQLEDVLNILRKMWSEPGKVSYSGKHHQITDAWCEPKPDPMIPILVGGAGKKTMRLAAQYADLWNWGMCDVEQYAELTGVLRQYCDDLGRDPTTLRLTWAGSMAIGRTEAEAQRHDKQLSGGGPFVGTPDQIAAKMAGFIDIGVDYFILRIAGLPNLDVAGLVTEELMPRIKAL